MKKILYQLMTEINHGSEEEPRMEQVFSAVSLDWSEANEALAAREAYNGEYTVEDNGEPEPEDEGDVYAALDAAYREGVNSI